MDKIKEKLSPELKWKLKSTISLFSTPLNYVYDFTRYIRYCASGDIYKNRKSLESFILKEYHRLEKGLSLSEPKLNFGESVIKNLYHLVNAHIAKHGGSPIIAQALNTLDAYHDFHQKQNSSCIVNKEENSRLRNLISSGKRYDTGGGTLTISKNSILEESSKSFASLVKSRHSVRQFENTQVCETQIAKAVEISLKTPSVCNRQSTKIYSFSKKEDKEKILSLQNGNKGFGHQASHVLIVTSNLNCFEGAAERNQCYVDGGLMAMTLCYSLHSIGLATCFLNWSATKARDKALHISAKIPDNEVIITLMAVGSMPDDLIVAESPRRSIDEVLVSTQT
ncbi:nitroreductase family protein [Pseudomonas sp. MPC6]|uniref:nitroreductase family protein n=1 Tax=unclassified Pseudomonas TaxID=196821 RepID=UPI001110A7FA|nr:nitroreductase family protein [Pseudomonas sp. MPC6]QCY11379.1 nitroreductase [Pseudomonas sp. MPC6]